METIIDYDPVKNSKLCVSILDPDRGIETKVAKCDIDKFSVAYNNLIRITDRSVIPAALRWVSKNGDVILWERPPHYVTLQYSPFKQHSIQANSKASHTFRLALPWQYYFVSLSREGKVNNIFMYFGHDQIRDISSHIMYTAPIMNFYSNGRLCPAAYNEFVDYGNSYDEIIEFVYTTIWYSGFNNDLYETLGTIPPTNKLAKVRSDPMKLYAAWSKLPISYVASMPLSLAVDNVLAWAQTSLMKVNSDNQYTPGEDIGIALTIAAQDAESMV